MNQPALAIVDYGVGNLRNVQKAFAAVGVRAAVSGRPADISAAAALILPGVGAFGDAVGTLRRRGLAEPVAAAAQSGVPLLGICVGMQLLFDHSDEMGHHTGLGLIPGRVTRFPAGLTVPHMGWNQIVPARPHPLLNGIAPGSFAYFAHSYLCRPEQAAHVIAHTDYHGLFAGVVAHKTIVGIQFHPEKSQRVGLQLLKNFADFCFAGRPSPAA
ncbi:MAG: imidazole glycerol phosphate synthase subunit HisH [Anaerolineae bacterium]